METSKRRLSCPLTVQNIWNAIESLNAENLIADKDNVFKILSRDYNMTLGDVERQLRYAFRDELISGAQRTICKVNRKSIEPESYGFPDKNQLRDRFDRHDWYCFECHRSGEVFCCETCFRVYHPFCIKDDVSALKQFVCPVCKMLSSESICSISKKDLNVLLGYTCNRLKEKPLKHSIQNEEEWRRECLVYCYIDLNMMESKTAKQMYSRIEQYQVDVQTIVHNVVIFYGVHSAYADYARHILADCNYDIAEILQCRDCYRMSNEKQDKFWFCQPCAPLHELVFAKQKGYPYWPAKVIKKSKAVYDVRFFGDKHERADVDKEYIKPISTSVKSLNIKPTARWNKAMEELKKHTTILQNLRLQQRTLDTDSDSVNESDGEPSPKRPCTMMRKLIDVKDDTETTNNIHAENVSSPTIYVKNETCQSNSEQDDVNVVSSSSQESANIQHHNMACQTGHWSTSIKLTKCKKVKDEPGEMNKQMRELKEKLESQFRESKEAALRELVLKLDQKHYEDTTFFVNAEAEKLRQLEFRLNEKHKQEIAALSAKISEIKKKQWCWVCENEAKYYCCWNTSYCSVECQVSHWNNEHKQVCRRQRS